VLIGKGWPASVAATKRGTTFCFFKKNWGGGGGGGGEAGAVSPPVPRKRPLRKKLLIEEGKKRPARSFLSEEANLKRRRGNLVYYSLCPLTRTNS